MFKLDNDFLVSLGLGGLPVEEKNKLLQHTYETLEMRVGMRLAEKMTDSQLDEFESFIDRNDEAGALRWLETNFPNYKDVVAEELEKLKQEVSQAAPHILSAAANAQNNPQQSPAPQDMPPAAQAPSAPYQNPTFQTPYQPQQPAFSQPPPQPSYQQPFPQDQPQQPPAQPQQFTPPPGFTPGQ
ncbi:hypothetical protein H0V99_03245 [Candidatus Saccharibacteria bacterium]|nr:hypothetical protein [Candidatus Saccharibacteria bacterium]